MSDCKHEHTYLTDAGYFNACESCDEPVSAEGGRIAVAFERIAELEAKVAELESPESVCQRFQALLETIVSKSGRVGISADSRGFRHILETTRGQSYGAIVPTLAVCMAGLREAAEEALRERFIARFGTD